MFQTIATGWEVLVLLLPDLLAIGIKVLGAGLLAFIFIHGVKHAPEGGRGAIVAGLALAVVTCAYEAARWQPSALPLPEMYPLTHATVDSIEKLLVACMPIAVLHYWAAPSWDATRELAFSLIGERFMSLLVVVAISTFVPLSLAVQGETLRLESSLETSLKKLDGVNVAKHQYQLEVWMLKIDTQLSKNEKYCVERDIACPATSAFRREFKAVSESLGFVGKKKRVQGDDARISGAEPAVRKLYGDVFKTRAEAAPDAQGSRFAEPKAAPNEVWKRLRKGLLGDLVNPLGALLFTAHWTCFLLLVVGHRMRASTGRRK